MRVKKMLPAVGGLTGVLALAGMAVAPAANATSQAPVHGQAYALKTDVHLLNRLVNLDLPPTPLAVYPQGTGEKSVVSLNSKDLLDGPNRIRVGLLNASSNVHDGVLKSDASTLDAYAHLEGVLELNAKVLDAQCTADRNGIHGSSKIVDAHLKTAVTGDTDLKVTNPNTAIDVRGVGKVILNEQGWHDGTFSVNAVHIHVDTALANVLGADIVISHAECAGNPGGPNTPQPGGGHSTTPPSGNPGTPVGNPGNPGNPGGGNNPGNPGGGNNSGGNGQGSLAHTGADNLLPLAGGAVALIAAGGAAMYVTRRRRAARHAG